MKKNVLFKSMLFTLIMTITLTQINAQTRKGMFLTETGIGNINFGKIESWNENQSVSDSKTEGTNFNIDLYPRAGLFLSDNFVLGSSLNINFHTSQRNYIYNGIISSESKSAYTSLGLFPFARYYFWSSSNGKSLLYGQISGGYYFDLYNINESNIYDQAGLLFSSMKSDNGNKFNTLTGSITAGWNRYISENIALNFGLGYQYSHNTMTSKYSYYNSSGVLTETYETTSIYNSSDINWEMGFTMFLPCKK